MKTSNKLLLTFVILVTGLCVLALIIPFFNIVSSSGVTLVKEGNLITVKNELPVFNKIYVTGLYSVNITQGRENSIAITAEENVIPQVKYKVVNKELVINARSDVTFGADGKSVIIEKFAPLKVIEINIITKQLTKIRCDGICTIKANNINVKDFYINFNGFSILHINGKVKNLYIDSKGLGRIYADELQAKNVKIELKGASRVAVWATKKLSVDMDGWNYLNYKGKPKNIKPMIKGYGKITETSEVISNENQ